MESLSHWQGAPADHLTPARIADGGRTERQIPSPEPVEEGVGRFSST